MTFSCSGTITLTSTIAIAADTTIDGSGQNVTISGGGAVGVFVVNPGVTLNLNKLTVADGKAIRYGGGIYNNAGVVNVTNCTFSGNSADQGGGIFDEGNLTVTNSTFFGNNGGQRGGAIWSFPWLTVINSTFFGNSAEQGGRHLGQRTGGDTRGRSRTRLSPTARRAGTVTARSPTAAGT